MLSRHGVVVDAGGGWAGAIGADTRDPATGDAADNYHRHAAGDPRRDAADNYCRHAASDCHDANRRHANCDAAGDCHAADRRHAAGDYRRRHADRDAECRRCGRALR